MTADEQFHQMMLDHIWRQEMLAIMAGVGTVIVLSLYAWGWWSGRWKP